VSIRVADIVGAIHDAFPPEWAETWDRVGLIAGDPDAPVSRVLVSLDPSLQALQRALRTGAQVLVTHHPPFLEAVPSLTPRGSGVAFAAVRDGVALVAAHTNLDRAPAGAAALPAMLGLDHGAPLEDAHLEVSMVTVYVPGAHERAVAEAMAAAGAGRIGEYRGCSFVAPGTGTFTAPEDSAPCVGAAGSTSSAEELRLEMVAPQGRAGAVVAAARRSHPYEEPLITVTELSIARGDARMGRVSALTESMTLSELAGRVSGLFGITPRVWGPREASVRLVATAAGSAGSLVPAAVSAGADVLVAGEVRYHDAQAAAAAGLCVIEIGHDVSEWPLVRVLADAVARVPGLNAESIIIDPPDASWWTPQRSD
jgi:dinuclear metal center YbgI/SA1388 family protein